MTGILQEQDLWDRFQIYLQMIIIFYFFLQIFVKLTMKNESAIVLDASSLHGIG